jgi:hypothetical protein
MIEIVPPITHIETIAEGSGIQELSGLRQQYGPGNWKKKKGIAMYGSSAIFRQERRFIGMKLTVSARSR